MCNVCIEVYGILFEKTVEEEHIFNEVKHFTNVTTNEYLASHKQMHTNIRKS